MIQNKTSIIYLAHGPKHLHRQSIFSILTLCHFLNFDLTNINIVIYTDDQAVFEKHLKGLPFKCEHLTNEQVKSYIKNDYVHRVKICVIQDCMKKYGSNVLFVDGDTYFLKSPVNIINKISKEYTVFHSFESTIADGGPIHEVPIWLTLRKLARNYEYSLKGEKFKLSFDSQVWNSGILGLSTEYYSLIDDVLDLNDQMTRNERLKTAEQVAFTYIMRMNSTLIAGEEFVYHYFMPQEKNLYNYHIGLFLKKYLRETIQTKAKKAVDLSHKQDRLTLPEKTLFEKIKLRCSLIWKVARYGHL